MLPEEASGRGRGEGRGGGFLGDDNVTCKYRFGLIFSILLGNWLCFLFWGGGLVCNTLSECNF